MAGPARRRQDTGAITLFERRVADEGKNVAGVNNSGRVGAVRARPSLYVKRSGRAPVKLLLNGCGCTLQREAVTS